MSEAPRHVLYVDDDEGLRALVRRALERRGYVVDTAASGEEGQAKLLERAYDIVALDHYMPGRGGFETLKAILTEIADPPPIVYVTGSDETRVAVAALKAGAADYVVKSVGEEFFDLLANAFQNALEQTRLRRQHAEAQAALATSNERLETLLREVNHRVANSLQIVSAFVQMQASMVGDEGARSALRDTQRRIEAIVQVHRRLYTTDQVEWVDMQDYLEALVRELEGTCSTPTAPRSLKLTADPIRLETDKAVSVGVIVNELITNACKYAYAGDEAGEVRIHLGRDGAHVLLRVEDDGRGLEGATPKGTGLGGRLIRAMAHSLNSKVEYEPAERGVRAVLRVPA
ncbi:sensor histidine kinase [Phenylobacterium sp. J367]|uniref:sensor histidine kinase n=1 Tax=Phenylobacterium sp. J367 TaxID=2898435 RepID=UPI002151B469|nr:response regulator [Phenylobacterium sp. J367]MCR5878549.1 response regulator [Phenylobacterium sp. J367]